MNHRNDVVFLPPVCFINHHLIPFKCNIFIKKDNFSRNLRRCELESVKKNTFTSSKFWILFYLLYFTVG
ncbi:hypothetical protein NPIL_557111 [Nephila pilipes]|uniref:Uncharacterized protein n=1 Tax=Nephila pilipes TaxID=299642 RepID=A0A8X6PGA2_NEPPI|nr:hypothetical protein NPIL_557111 [Nephila pilipes]